MSQSLLLHGWAGGMTSHAAVVARGMGRPCVAGAGSITVDYAAAKLTVGSVTVTEGQILTIDGSTGEVMVGEVPTVLWQFRTLEKQERHHEPRVTAFSLCHSLEPFLFSLNL